MNATKQYTEAVRNILELSEDITQCEWGEDAREVGWDSVGSTKEALKHLAMAAYHLGLIPEEEMDELGA